jgi:phosphocarrier protein
MREELKSNNKATGEVSIPCEHGLHLRPATLVIQTANRFHSEIEFVNGSLRVNARSILDLLINIGPLRGERFEVHAVGSDAADAVKAIVDLFSSTEMTCEEIAGYRQSLPLGGTSGYSR